MTRLLALLAILAAVSIAAIWVVLHEMSDRWPEPLPNVVPPTHADGEFELWERRSGNRLGTGDYHRLAVLREVLVRRYANDPDDLVIGRTVPA